MNSRWNYIALHFAILTWGAAGVVAKLMTLSSAGIVVYRSLIAAVILFVFHLIRGKGVKVHLKDKLYLVVTGMMMGLHWWGFFTAIQVSTISIALICISSAPVFVAAIQLLVEKMPIKTSQILLGTLSVIGIALIFKFETRYQLGIICGVFAGAADAVYSVMTSRTRPGIPSVYMTQLHMTGAGLVIFFTDSILERKWGWLHLKTPTDYIGILFLGVVCSAISMSLYVLSIKRLSAFTATLSLNMEAVYGICLAILVFGAREYLSTGFYVGACLLVGCVLTDSILKARLQKLKAVSA